MTNMIENTRTNEDVMQITVGEELYQFTYHAQTVVAERELSMEWIKITLASPERVEVDKYDSQLIHVLKHIPEYGHRVLRVIYNGSSTPKRIVTTYFDRRQKD